MDEINLEFQLKNSTLTATVSIVKSFFYVILSHYFNKRRTFSGTVASLSLTVREWKEAKHLVGNDAAESVLVRFVCTCVHVPTAATDTLWLPSTTSGGKPKDTCLETGDCSGGDTSNSSEAEKVCSSPAACRVGTAWEHRGANTNKQGENRFQKTDQDRFSGSDRAADESCRLCRCFLFVLEAKQAADAELSSQRFYLVLKITSSFYISCGEEKKNISTCLTQ